jgi:hypothetical protein
LVDLAGLDSLTSITGNAYSVLIASNDKLQNLDGLKELKTADGSVQIANNPSLINFCGLKPLFTTGYNKLFYVENNGNNPTQNQVVDNCP